MEINEFIASGIIEVYCMGMASDEEKRRVEELALSNREVVEEIDAVNQALQMFTADSERVPSAHLKSKIMDAIAHEQKQTIHIPPRLSEKSTVSEWLKYLSDNNLSTPPDYELVHLLDLPGDEIQVTYVAWAKKGAVVEEMHDDEDEFLFMLKGHCSVTINGKIGYYKEGDVIYIPKKSVHRAEALSDEPMLLIGQRIAA